MRTILLTCLLAVAACGGSVIVEKPCSGAAVDSGVDVERDGDSYDDAALDVHFSADCVDACKIAEADCCVDSDVTERCANEEATCFHACGLDAAMGWRCDLP